MILELDRKSAPAAYDINKTNIIEAEKININDYKVFSVKGGTESVIKLEIVFPYGNRTEKQKLIAAATNYLINSGTHSFSSKEIMENFDYYGAFYQHDNSFDRASLSIYTLKRYYKEIFDIFFDIIQNANFPDSEIEIYKENSKQRFIVNSTKNDFLARRAFNYALFNEHPYGYKIDQHDFDTITREHVVDYYNSNYNLKDSTIIISGDVSDDVISELSKHLKNHQASEVNSTNNLPSFFNYEKQVYFEERKDALQSAIRIGRPIINKKHEDFIELNILSTILGGYFGSRLMTNIREDKGYTYGIGAGLYSLLDTGFFYIATEVGADVCQKALDEIYFELKRLNTELIPDSELDLVRNYLKGSYINNIENIFSHADKFKGIHFYDLNYEYYDKYFKLLNSVNSERLMLLAKEYLNVDLLSEVVIGKK
jgi:predicted Zn-dependent peptidase